MTVAESLSTVKLERPKAFAHGNVKISTSIVNPTLAYIEKALNTMSK